MSDSEYHIASFIAYVMPDKSALLSSRIDSIPGVEVHASTDADCNDSKGKIVFTIEGEKSKFISRKMDEIREFEDIIMLAPVYHEYMAGGTTENQKIADQRGSL